MRLYISGIVLALSYTLQASQAQPVADSINLFGFDKFYHLVVANHPVVRQANLLLRQASEEFRMARGAFDPKIEASWQSKEYQTTRYYDMLDAVLKVPLWFPIEPKVGFEKHTGAYLNPENYISDKNNNQMLYMGISVPLGQGLFIDQRRATVQQARLLQDMAEAEQVKLINKILLTATKDYWEWYYAYNSYLYMQQSIDIAQDIFDRTRLGFELGEVAAIDTVQALISLQKRTTDFLQANLERIRAAFTLSNHLWNSDGLPLELQDNARPDTFLLSEIDISTINRLIAQARTQHPELLKLDLKNQTIDIDRQLARENLKPKVNLDYALLNQPFVTQGKPNELSLVNNYKIELNLSVPLFLRKERGKLAMMKLKLQDNELDKIFMERSIVNAVNAQYAALTTMGNMIIQQQNMVANYELIVAAERFNLENGESDLFKINAQLDKLIEARTKLFKLRASYKKDLASLYGAAGVPYLGFGNL